MSTISIVILILILLVAAGGLIFALLQDAFVRIEPGQMGLVVVRGKPKDRGLSPGVHFALRFGRAIEIYPSVEVTYMTLPAKQALSTPDDTLTYIDPPLRVTLGDRTVASVLYTIRFRIRAEALPLIHTRFGNSGIKGILRDESRRVITKELGSPGTAAADATGDRREALEARVQTRLAGHLNELGFELALFSLRYVDLGDVGDLIQQTIQAQEELTLEVQRGRSRALRAEQDAELVAKLNGGLSPAMIEYLRLQALRDLIQRWDGEVLAPFGLQDITRASADTPAQPPENSHRSSTGTTAEPEAQA